MWIAFAGFSLLFVEGFISCHSEWSYRDKEWVELYHMKQTLTIRSGGHMATRIEFHKHGGPEVLQAVEFTPADPAENEIQVENKAIGMNFIDTYIRSGLYPLPSLPSGLGTEAAGIVSKVGSGVKHIKAGDRVVYAQSALGAYSSVHNIIADKAAILPAAISFEQAAASFLKGLTVYYLLRKTYEIKPMNSSCSTQRLAALA
ncbi:alcohol dehydrogenase catalytic domain-containing protein [Escherichia coli]